MSTHSKSLAEVVTSLTNESFALVNGAHFITLTMINLKHDLLVRDMANCKSPIMTLELILAHY